MRKDQHIEFSLIQDNKNNCLDKIRLKYYSLPNINIEDVDISTSFCGIKQKLPFYINAMTGGSEKANLINKRLELICKKLSIFMFSGSYTPALNNDNYYYPKNMGVNIGADKSFESMQIAINKTNAKILQIHINPIQEFMMKNGDINFSNWENNIKKALENITIPIILKETGFGMGEHSFEKALELGIKTIDISGKGGTNFAYIEDKRINKDRSYLYELGYSTKDSLIYSRKYQDKLEILASGGITNPIDIVKCLALGAKSVGIAGHILKLIDKYTDNEIIDVLEQWIYEIKAIMAITNSKNIEELKDKWEEI
ncbi:type 2 isopentenyl-diphosphate Delta-isomerase [Caviibacter abscessus]|uniref:type 2 isopentenyl-diphosphate Delta-isomerase n=1 Tax=Caviibacter abscessus TaxID=1766719 RepID=UPI00083018A7|nr:type 2 isopentenyl-diphosphate Delta-isomerase [Caviibacter abscessus]